MDRKSMRVAKGARRGSRSRASEGLDVLVPVSRVMMEYPSCVGPDLSALLARLLMLEQTVGALPVVDELGRPIGMLSKTDIVRETRARTRSPRPGSSPEKLESSELHGDLDSEEGGLRALDFYVEGIAEPRVRDLMTPLVVCVTADTPLLEAARLMMEHEIHHLPVIGRLGELVGLLSSFDFVRAVARLAAAEGARTEGETERPPHSAARRGW